MDRIRQIRRLGAEHNFTLVCRTLSEVAQYTKMDNAAHRLIKALSPGAYTFILKGTKEVPRRLLHPKRKSIGIRIPDNRVALALAQELNEPIMSTTLILPGETTPLTDPHQMRETLGHAVDLIIDGGFCGTEPTTVLAFDEGPPALLRRGKGDASLFEGG